MKAIKIENLDTQITKMYCITRNEYRSQFWEGLFVSIFLKHFPFIIQFILLFIPPKNLKYRDAGINLTRLYIKLPKNNRNFT